MNMAPKPRPVCWLSWALAALTLLLAAMLIIQCADIYRIGISPENLTASGTRIADIYSRELVAHRLSGIAWVFWLWLTALIAAIACRIILPSKDRGVSRPEPRLRLELTLPHVQPSPAIRILQAILYTAALGFIIAGILNGGMYDVLVKAINICTECIGLG